MKVDIHHKGTKLGWAETPLPHNSDMVTLNGNAYPLEIQGDYGYVDLDVIAALKLKKNLHRVNKENYVQVMFWELLSTYYVRFKQNAHHDLHGILHSQAEAIVEELW